MGLHDLFRVGVIGCYGLAIGVFLAGALGRRDILKRLGVGLLLGGFGLHTLNLLLSLAGESLLTLPKGYYIKLLSWSVLLACCVFWNRLRPAFVVLAGGPMALALYVFSLPLFGSAAVMPKALSGLFFGLHIGSLFGAVALSATAFAAGLFFLTMERKIKTKEKLSGFQKDLPALNVFDRINHWAVLIGFPLYTVGLLSGFVWAHSVWGRTVTWDPKEVVSLLIWFVYAFWFHQRLAMGWRGCKPARLAVWTFSFILVSLVGVNLIASTHHSLAP